MVDSGTQPHEPAHQTVPRAEPGIDVVFVVMPFADLSRPAIGVSLLEAAARRDGRTARIEYGNLRLAEIIGAELYGRVANELPPDLLLGEWVFAADLFGSDVPAAQDYLEQVVGPYISPAMASDLLRARASVTGYLDRCAARIMADSPAVVGFTSTFHQTCASLAVARRLKALDHPPTIVFGGANCEAEMGEQMLRSFDCIDVVCSGESDVSFPRLLDHLLDGGPRDLDGVHRRDGASTGSSHRITAMDTLPVPDFDDYFDDLAASALEVEPQLPIETARGCWWGERRHCTFCGLNGETMAFRSKSPDRAFSEMTHLARRHGTAKVSCVDNILDTSYVETLFPRLAESDIDFEIFYEVKANLRREELRQMRLGGVRSIQPGIESLSDQVLRLMRKGVTAFHNVQLLRWCLELDVDCAWNILTGFPGEEADEYRRMAELIPALSHLQPPCSCAQVRLDRFSPFHSDPAAFGFTNVRPARAYYFVYPLGRRDLNQLAYYFDYGRTDDVAPAGAAIDQVRLAVHRWWDLWTSDERPRLDAQPVGDDLIVTDTRPVARAAEHLVSGLAARLLQRCDRTTTVTALSRSGVVEPAELDRTIGWLVDDGLLARVGGQLVSLVVFRDRTSDHLSDQFFGEVRDVRSTAQAVDPPTLLALGRSSRRTGG